MGNNLYIWKETNQQERERERERERENEAREQFRREVHNTTIFLCHKVLLPIAKRPSTVTPS